MKTEKPTNRVLSDGDENQQSRPLAVTRSFDGLPSFNHSIITEFQEKVTAEFENHLSDYLLKNLSRLGFEFVWIEDFHEFLKRRVSRIAFTEDPNTFQFYLDFKNEDERGILIGEYSDRVEFNHSANSISITIGKSFG